MKTRNTLNHETSEGLKLDYIMAAAYYFLRAEGDDENLVSCLNRVKAGRLKERMEYLGIEIPGHEQIYSYAEERWPKHRLHN